MADIEIDDDRVEKLPLWAGELIYALDSRRKAAERAEQARAAERDEARQQLLDHLNANNGPADSDTFLERDDVPHDETETAPLGLGRGAQVSFGAPALRTGNEDPSIQARMIDGRLVLTTEYGDLAFAIMRPGGHTTGTCAITVTIV